MGRTVMTGLPACPRWKAPPRDAGWAPLKRSAAGAPLVPGCPGPACSSSAATAQVLPQHVALGIMRPGRTRRQQLLSGNQWPLTLLAVAPGAPSSAPHGSRTPAGATRGSRCRRRCCMRGVIGDGSGGGFGVHRYNQKPVCGVVMVGGTMQQPVLTHTSPSTHRTLRSSQGTPRSHAMLPAPA